MPSLTPRALGRRQRGLGATSSLVRRSTISAVSTALATLSTRRVRRGENREADGAIVAVIETKGCWNAELFTAIETQLCNDYPGGWVRRSAFTGLDGFTRRNGTKTIVVKEARSLNEYSEVRRRLNEKAAELAKGYIIRAVVLDCHAH